MKGGQNGVAGGMPERERGNDLTDQRARSPEREFLIGRNDRPARIAAPLREVCRHREPSCTKDALSSKTAA
ncbi:hypothetical protein BV133_2121 [Blastochloris viridis]|uniref:Uncharacterized protein n=1 Tax=Blastochloris viridis TaxID=1079 RepID=A0A182D2S0_BLAVI|nr:hypothetical protein BV133_2121 [Blastochloris viridis]